MGIDLVVMGVSRGGAQALKRLLGGLPADFPLPIAVVQHRHASSGETLLAGLRSGLQLALCEPDDKEPMSAGTVYLAPADYHLLVEPGWFALSIDAPVRHARPSADVLFESAADAFGAGVLAVVLTGANDDGARGALRVRQAGGRVLVQDPASATTPDMPRAAIAAGAAHEVLALEEMAGRLLELCGVG